MWLQEETALGRSQRRWLRDGDGSGIVSVLEEWGGGSELYVVTWFDQSGAGNDASVPEGESSMLQWDGTKWIVNGGTAPDIVCQVESESIAFIGVP